MSVLKTLVWITVGHNASVLNHSILGETTIFFFDLQSSQDFTNPAFESDDGYLDDHQFSDIVDQVLRQPLNGQYVHPYGQGNLYKAILVGEKTKVPQSAGKLVFWAVFMLLMAGIACTIIILAGNNHTACILEL